MGFRRLINDFHRKSTSPGVLFSYTGNLYGAGDFPSAPALQSAAGNTAPFPAPIPENPLAGRFLQGGAWVFSLTIWVLCGIIIRYRYVYLLGIPLKIKSDTGGQLP